MKYLNFKRFEVNIFILFFSCLKNMLQRLQIPKLSKFNSVN